VHLLISLGRGHHPRPGRRSWYRGDILPLDLAPPAKDVCAVLGLLAAVGGGAAYDDQQV
jgi:hypothetical protein